MNEKLEKLNRELARTEVKLRRAQHEEKILEHQMKTLTRKERTHRLCIRGAMLESFLPCPSDMTDEEIKRLLNIMFHRSGTEELIQRILSESKQEQGGGIA